MILSKNTNTYFHKGNDRIANIKYTIDHFLITPTIEVSILKKFSFARDLLLTLTFPKYLF